jgi:myo-inositol-1(or 4)-monophosphatase
MSDELDTFLSTAWEAANNAGTVIREAWGEAQEIEYKGAIDLVTPTDRASERRIIEVLRRRFPEHSMIAEEETNLSSGRGSYCWIIDPLDGTTNFAHSYPHFCVSIALERDGQIIVGLVYDPLRRECFSAVKGQNTTLNGKAIKISTVEKLDRALLATGFPYDRRENADQYLTYFKAFMTRTQGIRRSGSAALDLCYVACGRIDGFWELKLRPWDVAAASLIIEEAGGKLSDFSGNEFTIWGTETLASNNAIHEEMVSVAKSVRNDVNSRGKSQP